MIGCFPHAPGPPSEAALRLALGAAGALWDELAATLAAASGGSGTWRSYGPRTGWRLDFRRGKGPLAGLYPQEGFLILGINLVQDEGARAFDLELSPGGRAVLAEAAALPDGRFLLLPVRDARGLDDARRLVELKGGSLRA